MTKIDRIHPILSYLRLVTQPKTFKLARCQDCARTITYQPNALCAPHLKHKAKTKYATILI